MDDMTKLSQCGDPALGVILANVDAMLRRHARTLAGQLKELLLAFIDSLDGTKKQQTWAEEIEQSCLGDYRTHS